MPAIRRTEYYKMRDALLPVGTLIFDAILRHWRCRRQKLTAPLSHRCAIGSTRYTARLACLSRLKVAPGAVWICPVLHLQRDGELSGGRGSRSARPCGIRGKGRGEGGKYGSFASLMHMRVLLLTLALSRRRSPACFHPTQSKREL